MCVHHLFLLSCPISIPFSQSPTCKWIDFCEYLFFRMLDSNYTAFEGNIIGAVTRMAFGSPISQLMTRVLYFMMCWMLFIVIYIYIYIYIYIFGIHIPEVCLSACIWQIFVLLHILWVVIICLEPRTIFLLYLVQNNWTAKWVKKISSSFDSAYAELEHVFLIYILLCMEPFWVTCWCGWFSSCWLLFCRHWLSFFLLPVEELFLLVYI